MFKALINGQASKFLVAVLAALGESARTGRFDWKSLVAGLIGAVAVFLVPNAQPPAVTPPPASPPAKEPAAM